MASASNSLTVHCQALFLAGPASGQGKTTVTAALSRALRNLGKVVHVFKTGPDYLDPQVLAQASGHSVEQLDIWMAGEPYCKQRIYDAAKVADYILVEGAMGLFDGEPSSADLAACFGIPIAIVMDVKGMAQTTAAIVSGLANHRDDIQVRGLIANNCGSERHAELIRDALLDSTPLLATLKRDESIALPERHLGLVQASEATDVLEERFEAGAEALIQGTQGIENLQAMFSQVSFASPQIPEHILPTTLKGKTIAIAKDEAFSFIYQANLDLLETLGASYQFFSPIHDSAMPEADALWLPGGYPELHAKSLSLNTKMLKSIAIFFAMDRPVLAECGGFLYCLESLTDLNDECYPMLSLLKGHGAMRGKRGCQGMQTAVLPEGELRGHAHHRSRSFDTDEPFSHARRQRHPAPGEALYRSKGLTASYLHFFFPNNPDAIAQIFSQEWHQKVAEELAYVS